MKNGAALIVRPQRNGFTHVTYLNAIRLEAYPGFHWSEAQHGRAARYDRAGGHGRAHGRALPALYLQQLAQASTAVMAIGLLAGMDDLLSALYSFPGGYLSDRLGTKRALLFFNALSIIGYLCVILIRSWWAVLIGAAFISSSAISLPATMDLLAKVVPKNRRTMGVSVLALVRRVPKMLGPVVGGACIAVWGVEQGVRAAFILALVLLAASVLQQLLITDDSKDAKAAEANPLAVARDACQSAESALVGCAHSLLRAHSGRFRGHLGHPLRAASVGTRWARSPPSKLHRGAGIHPRGLHGRPLWQEAFRADYLRVLHLLPDCAPAFAFAWTPGGGVCAPRAQGIRRADPQGADHGSGTEGRKAAMFGLYYLVRDVLVAFAAFGGALLWRVSPELNLKVAFAFGVLGTLWFAWRGRDCTVPPTVNGKEVRHVPTE